MAVVIIPKNKPLIQFPDKKSATDYLIAMGKKPENFDMFYIYTDMARRCYPPSYKELHKKAARAWYERNKAKVNKEKRNQYKENKKNESI
jgi:hypothetical protein